VGDPEPEQEGVQDEPLPPLLLLAVVLALTLLLTVWAAFLVPLRLSGGLPLPLWLVPLGGMLALAAAAAHRVGLAGALAPALVWLALTMLVLAPERPEGDIVFPRTLSAYAYLYGGMLLWAVLVLRMSAAERTERVHPATPTTAPRR
jgi:hypothetical protein